jgi:hypothetical protein
MALCASGKACQGLNTLAYHLGALLTEKSFVKLSPGRICSKFRNKLKCLSLASFSNLV